MMFQMKDYQDNFGNHERSKVIVNYENVLNKVKITIWLFLYIGGDLGSEKIKM